MSVGGYEFWVKIRLKALAKPTFGMSLGVIQLVFNTENCTFFGNHKRLSPPF